MDRDTMRTMRLTISEIVAEMFNSPDYTETSLAKMADLLAGANAQERDYIMQGARIILWTLKKPDGDVSGACSMFVSDHHVRCEIGKHLGADKKQFLEEIKDQDIDGLASSKEELRIGDCSLRLENISCEELLVQLAAEEEIGPSPGD